jgi:hypothetical protein
MPSDCLQLPSYFLRNSHPVTRHGPILETCSTVTVLPADPRSGCCQADPETDGYNPTVHFHHNGLYHIKIWTEICRIENNKLNNTVYVVGFFLQYPPATANCHVPPPLFFWQLHQQPYLPIIRYRILASHSKQPVARATVHRIATIQIRGFRLNPNVTVCTESSK